MKRLCIALVLVLTVTVSASGATVDHISATGYDPKVDYSALMIECAKDGSPHALVAGRVYETQRNAKIDGLGLKYKKSNYFSTLKTGKDILAAMRGYTGEDLDLLARLVNAEAGANWVPDWVQQAVASVVLNRVKSSHYPNTIRDVIYQRGQYGPAWNGSINRKASQKCIRNARKALEVGGTIPAGVVGQSGYISGKVYKSYHDAVLGTTIYFCYG